jgi:hypothetical protein
VYRALSNLFIEEIFVKVKKIRILDGLFVMGGWEE